MPGALCVSSAFAFTVIGRSAPWVSTPPRAVSPVVCGASTVMIRPARGISSRTARTAALVVEAVARDGQAGVTVGEGRDLVATVPEAVRAPDAPAVGGERGQPPLAERPPEPRGADAEMAMVFHELVPASAFIGPDETDGHIGQAEIRRGGPEKG